VSIHIIEDEIRITRAQHEKYLRDYNAFCQYHANPPTFEAYVRQHLEYKRLDL
jgi:hypothetical protein